MYSLVWWLVSQFCVFPLPLCQNGQNIDKTQAPNPSYQLVFAHVLHRHGDRNINSVYPNDPYKDNRYWPRGRGALTEIGEQQAYALGKFLRHRYNHLVGTTYSSDKVYIRSTGRERTLMTAKWCANGLFNQSDVNWLSKIHKVETAKDYLLFPEAKCARFSQLQNKYLESKAVVDIWKKNHPLIKFIDENSGKRLHSFADIASIYDILHVENLKGFRLPSWANETMSHQNTLEYLVGLYYESYTQSTELKQLKAGYLIKEMLDHFYMKINSTLRPDRNLWIYSAHDITIAIFLNALGLYDMRIPPYASSVHFELYKFGREYYVQIIYRKSASDNNPQPLNIPKCGTMCPLDKFKDLYRHILPTGTFKSKCRAR